MGIRVVCQEGVWFCWRLALHVLGRRGLRQGVGFADFRFLDSRGICRFVVVAPLPWDLYCLGLVCYDEFQDWRTWFMLWGGLEILCMSVWKDCR